MSMSNKWPICWKMLPFVGVFWISRFLAQGAGCKELGGTWVVIAMGIHVGGPGGPHELQWASKGVQEWSKMAKMTKNRKKMKFHWKFLSITSTLGQFISQKIELIFLLHMGIPLGVLTPKKCKKWQKIAFFYCILEKMKNPRKFFFEDPFFKKVARK